MNLFAAAYRVFSGLGSFLLIPVAFIILGRIARIDWKSNLQCALAILGSMVGINLLVTKIGTDMLAATNSMIERYSLAESAVNVSWSLSSAITLASSLVYYAVPIFIILNLLLVWARTVRVVNLDLWSYWQIAFIGTLVQTLTDNYWYGLIVAILIGILQFLLADAFAPQASRLIGAGNITFMQSFALGFTPIAWGVNWLIDRVPAFRGKYVVLNEHNEKHGIAGQPPVWGLVLGAVFGLVSGRGAYPSIEMGVVLGGCLFILPRLVRVFVRAVASVTDPLNRRIYQNGKIKVPLKFGVGALAGAANSTVILLAVFMAPVSILLAHILPGNVVMPQGDIAMLLYVMLMVVALSGGCIIRSLVSGVISIIAMLYCGTALTHLITTAAVSADAASYGTGVFNTLCNGANPLSFIGVGCSSFGVAGIAALGVVTLAAIFLSYRRLMRDNAVLTADPMHTVQETEQ